MVYSFTYGSQSDLTSMSSGISSSGTGTNASGVNDFQGGTQDNGTITVVVNGVAADTGLVVTIREDARNHRTAEPATCAVYGNGTVLCKSTDKVNSEEYALLRVLGQNFVDPSQIDAKNQWKIALKNPSLSMSSEFTVRKNDNGILSIDETRKIDRKGAQASMTQVTGKILYDQNKTLPLSLFEQTIERGNVPGGGYRTVNTQIDLKLSSDSMGAKLP